MCVRVTRRAAFERDAVTVERAVDAPAEPRPIDVLKRLERVAELVQALDADMLLDGIEYVSPEIRNAEKFPII